MADALHGRDLGAGVNVDAQVSYGLAGFQGTPFAGLRVAEGGARAFSSGVRYALPSGLGLWLEGTRRESALGAAEHSLGIRGRLRMR